MIKKCLICGKEFETVKYGESRKYCFECSPSYTKGDTVERGQTITAIRRALKNEIIKRMGGKCIKCGYNKCPASLDCHHVDPSLKDFNVSQYISGANVKVDEVFSEIEKCVLLCSNCHNEFHYLNNKDNLTLEDFLKV